MLVSNLNHPLFRSKKLYIITKDLERGVSKREKEREREREREKINRVIIMFKCLPFISSV